MRHRLNIGVIAAFLLMPLSLIAGSNPIEIGTLAELKAFAKRVNNGETTLDAVLTADITVSYNVLKYDGTDLRDHRYPPTVMWTSIGLTQDKAYRGTFDGQGHAINGLYGVTTKEYEHPVALFGFLDGATVKNLSIHDSYLMGGEGIWTGAIAHSSHESHITDIASAACVKGMDCACGLVGESDGDTFEHCLVVGSVESSVSGGTYGIAHTHNSTITECYTTTDDAEAIRGGGLTYYFNNGVTDGTQHWYQRIGIDNYPRDRFVEGGTVYLRYRDCQTSYYTNDANAQYAEVHHTFDVETATCKLCRYKDPSPQQAADGYYEIVNEAQFYWFCNYVNDSHPTACARLLNDITVDKEDNTAWQPMGTFSGTIDGLGHCLRGLKFKGRYSNAALIFDADKATIKNLGIEDCYFFDANVASPFALISFNAQFINCHSLRNYFDVSCSNKSGLVHTFRYGQDRTYLLNCYTDDILCFVDEMGYCSASNCYDRVTQEQLSSGELAYQLDQHRTEDSDHWYQRIGTDPIPVCSPTPIENGTVYYGYSICDNIGYSNDESLCSPTPVHSFNDQGVCVRCMTFEAPEPAEDGFYEISRPGHLYWFAKYVNAKSSHLTARMRLQNDIVIPADMPAWRTITEFNGTMDGQGYAIRGIRAEAEHSFIQTSKAATISNLRMADGSFDNYTASFVHHFNGGTMTNCSSVNCTTIYGFVRELNGGTLRNCFTDQNNIYTTVSGGTASNCYVSIGDTYTKCTSGETTYNLNQGVTDGSQAWYQRIGVDSYPVARPVNGGTVYRKIVQCRDITLGYTNSPDDQGSEHDLNEQGVCRYCGGDVEPQQENGYYLIANASHLLWFSHYVNQDESHRSAKARFVCDIDLKGFIWLPIQEFHGEIDGQGYTLRNGSFFNLQTRQHSPLVTKATDGAVVRNLCISDSYVHAPSRALFIETMDQASLLYCSAVRNDNSAGDHKASMVTSKSSNSIISRCFSDSYIYNGQSYGYPSDNYCNVTVAELASGELTYNKLNNKKTDGSQTWYQRIGTDTIPVARYMEDGIVYPAYASCTSSTTPCRYTNDKELRLEHDYVNGYCNACRKLQEPQKVDNYYQIANVGNLFWFSDHVNAQNYEANAKLVCDIDATNFKIGTWRNIKYYHGIFDGQGYAIKHLNITASSSVGGFVNYLSSGGTLQNIAFVECTCNSNAPVIVYNIGTNGCVMYCSGINNISTTAKRCLVGSIDTNGRMHDCFCNNDFICYDLDRGGLVTTNFSVTDEVMASGEIAYKVTNMYQRIGVDPYPVARYLDGGTVYLVRTTCNPDVVVGYTNDNLNTLIVHKYNEDGVCGYCPEYQFNNSYQKPEWDANYANGQGAYVIAKPGNLLWVKWQLCSYDRNRGEYKTLDKNLVFSHDIDMSNYDKWGSIGVKSNVTIDGQGHVIRGLNSEQAGKTALTDVCYGNIINLGIEQSRFTGGEHNVTFATEMRGKLLNCWSYNNYGDEAMVEQIYSGASVTSCFSDTYINWDGNAPELCKEYVRLEDMCCGDLTYFLNDGRTDGTQPWYQRLGIDDMPRPVVLDGGTVYIVRNISGDIDGYTNTNGSEAYHQYDQYDRCSKCENYKQPPFFNSGYQLSTPNHLKWLSNLMNRVKPQDTRNFYLAADIDMTGVPFVPIREFIGTLNGQGHTIRGLHLEDNVKTAFILKTNDATISHLSMEDNYFKAPTNASLVWDVGEYTDIFCCKALNNTHENSYQAGMIHKMTGERVIVHYCYTDNYLMTEDLERNYNQILSCYSHVSPEARKSGELAYKLNDWSNVNPHWYQRLGEDNEPVAREIEGGTVYYRNLTCAEDAEDGYTNYYLERGAHTYGEDHFCTVCHYGEPAPLGEDGYYELSHEGHLMWLAHYVNLGNEGNSTIKVKLMNDIRLNGNDDDNRRVWTPIGKDAEHPFRGEIDGQGYTISGLWTDDDSRDYVGLCGYTNEALVRNIVISDAQLRGKSYVGAIAGYAYDSSILNCRVIDDSSIEAVVADGDQKSGIHAGGLIGYAAGDTQLSSSYSMAAVSGRENSSVGGLIGMFNNDYHASCINSYYLDGKAPACWKYSDSKTAPTNLTFTMEQAANGQLTYRLNNEKSENVQWYQVLKLDLLPTTTVSTQGIVYPVQETCSATETTYSNIKPSNLVEHRFVMNDSPKVAGTNYYGRHCELCGFSDNKQFVIFNWDGKGSTLDVTECALRKLTIVNIPSMTIDADNIPEFNFGKLGKSFSYFVNTPIKFKREFHEGELYTVIFPFDVYEEEFKELGSFYKYSGIDQTHGAMQVNFNRVDDYYLTANVAYVFKPNKDISEIEIPETSDYGVELYGEYAFTLKPDNPGGIYGLYGTFHQMTIPYGAFGFLASTSQLARLSSTAWTRPFRAYIWLGNIDQSRISFTLTDEDTEETGIFAIEEDGSLTSFDSQDADATHNIPIYDLTGRRITRPISGHVYLRAGRKFIAK